jgi:hypothetical protein
MAEIPPRDPRKGDEQPVPAEPTTRPPAPGPEIEPGHGQPAETPTPTLPDEIRPPGSA